MGSEEGIIMGLIVRGAMRGNNEGERLIPAWEEGASRMRRSGPADY